MNAARASSILMVLVLGCGAPGPVESPPPPRPTAEPVTTAPEVATPAPAPREARYAVASESVAAVETARAVLEEGGSAADAAVASVLVGCAAHPSSCSLGGGGLAIVWDPTTKKAVVVDFREAAPRGLRPSDYLSRTPPEARRGVMIGVPGLVAGLAEIHRIGGKLAWSKVVGKAADVIERGIAISPYAAQSLEWNAKWIASDERAKGLWPAGAHGKVGETMKNAPLAATVRALADGGSSAFYTGALAADVVEAARAAGSRIGPDDLRRYKAVVREPLRIPWDRYEVFAAPPPGAGGFVVGQVLTMFSREDVRALELGSAGYVHTLAEALRGSYADRATMVGDPEYVRADLDAALDPAKLRARRTKIKPDATTMPKLPSVAEHGTLHTEIIDETGMVVTLTASLTSMFGAKVVTKGGFSLNDALSDFAMDEYGKRVVTTGPNAARGGARPASSFAPLLVVEAGAVRLALGGSGGLRATTGVLEVLLGHLAFGQPLPDAVAAPRFHVMASGSLKLDPPLAGLGPDLVGRGEVLDTSALSFSAVTAIAAREEGGKKVLEPVFDPRKGGAVTVGYRETTDGQNDPARRP